MFVIPNANTLLTYIKDFTGSSDDNEIKQCIFMAELSMRNIELPVLRSDPYDADYIATADAQGRVPIPGDMNKPILFFQQGGTTPSPTGPWIVYDRVGDRRIIAETMIAQFYKNTPNAPTIYRGNFSEVGTNYEFTPPLGAGAQVNLYYYRAWPLLFAPLLDQTISTTGTVFIPAGPSVNPQLVAMTQTTGLAPGDQIVAGNGTGVLGGPVATVVTIDSATSLTYSVVGGAAESAGTVINVSLTGKDVQTNQVLSSWPEGYVYATLREYYLKRHNEVDAAVYEGKFNQAWNVVEDQNNYGKWSGGTTKLTSVWQPRKYMNFNR
tara:strand:- start:2745 stop:3713 length:969 start_codon:yes stop_codon:yes gene_type:complete